MVFHDDLFTRRGLIRGFALVPRTAEDLQGVDNDPLTPAEIEAYQPNLRSYINGFASRALARRDLIYGICALEIASKNGVLNDPDALELIRSATHNNAAKVTAAEIIESLSQARAKASPDSIFN